MGSVVPAGSGTGHGFPDNGRAALYIIWDLPNKLEGLENSPAIVHAQSLLNFLVLSAGLDFVLGPQWVKMHFAQREEKGVCDV